MNKNKRYIDILKKISFIIDLVEKKQYSIAILEIEKFLNNDDFFFVCNQENNQLGIYLNNVIKYYDNKKIGLDFEVDILLFSLRSIKNSLLKNININEINFQDLDSFNLVDLNEFVHNYIYKYFEEHFKSLFENDLNKAYKNWQNLIKYIDKHSYIEDTIIEPFYIKSISKYGVPKGGDYKQFIYEHKMLKKISADIEDSLSKASINYDYFFKLQDSYFYFKNFWIHHGLREKNIFYKFLEEILEFDIKKDLKIELMKSIKEWEF